MEGARRGHFSLFWLSPPPVISPQILIPALMVTAEKDQVLVPEMSKHMEDWVRVGLPGALGECPGRERACVPEERGSRRQSGTIWWARASSMVLSPLGSNNMPDVSFSLH